MVCATFCHHRPHHRLRLPAQVMLLSCALAAVLCGRSWLVADEPPKPEPLGVWKLGTWKLETLRLKDGKVFHGVALDQRDADLDFAEIIQPAGKPMYAVLRLISEREILKLETLPAEEHRSLQRKFEQFRNRTLIEAGRMEELLLRQDEVGGKRHHLYDGPWFRVDSTTDEETTRRCIVRIEQIFRAYRMLLPPQGRPPAPLTVRLYGSMDEYRAELRRLQLNITNPAFYSSRERTILVGSDLNTYAEQLSEIRQHHEGLRKTWQQLDSDFQRGMPLTIARLRANGHSADEVTGEVRLLKARFKEQLDVQYNRIDEQDRRNESKFNDVTTQMFAQLYHEAFHAWLDNFVYARSRQNVPRWLNEGLAQVFEAGKLDGQSLRLDAPAPLPLALLQAELKSNPWPLARLLTEEDPPFVDGHRTGEQTLAQRKYAYAWGLAWYLTFHEQKLGSDDLHQFVSTPAAKLDPVERFEKFVGKRLPDFEQQWRKTMLDLRANR
jgi:hypothetical protein